MSFDFLDLLIACSLGYGFLQIQLLIFNKAERSITLPLGLLLFVLCWIQLEFLAVRNLWEWPVPYFFGTQYGSWLFLGPSLYYYIQASVKGYYDQKAYYAQMLAGILFVFLIPTLVDDIIPQRAVDYGMLTVLAYPHFGYTTGQAIYGFVFMAQFIHLAVYIIKSKKLLGRTEVEMKSNASNLFPLGVLSKLLILIVLLVGTSIGFFYLLLTSYQYYRYWDFFYTLPFAAITYFLVYKLQQYPHVLRTDLRLVQKADKYEKSRLDEELLASYAARLESHVNGQKVYLRKDLTLKQLADELNINAHHLSQVFNRALETTFFDYINTQRVEEAQRLLLRNNRPILEIAMDSGFATKASFNKYFKAVTGMTPSQFVKEADIKK